MNTHKNNTSIIFVMGDGITTVHAIKKNAQNLFSANSIDWILILYALGGIIMIREQKRSISMLYHCNK